MADPFIIYTDRLKGGDVQKISGPFDSSFFALDEPELKFPSPVEVTGEAYVSEDHLLIHLNGSTKAMMPCSVCNKMVDVPLEMTDYYHTEPLSDIPSAVYNFSEQLREAFLTELPKYIECNKGKCPDRAGILPFTREADSVKKDDTYFPFSDL